MGHVVLDLGHVGETGGRPPAKHGPFREDECVVRYAAVAYKHLVQAGHAVSIAGAGLYANRRAMASYGADLYVACHANMGGDDYGLVLHDHRSTLGARTAGIIAESLLQEWGGTVSKVKALPTRNDDWTSNAHSLISSIYRSPRCHAVVFEPGFLDSDRHRIMWSDEGLNRIGIALARGINLSLGEH